MKPDLDELRRLHEAGNESALHAAANSCRDPGAEWVTVPAWVLEALVKHNIEWMRELAPGRGKDCTRWGKQHQKDLEHLIRYSEVCRALQQGCRNESEAFERVAAEDRVTAGAIRASFRLVRKDPSRFYFGSPGWLDWKK
jgi:hypothetical protein